jgi:hypothetical protein
MICGMHVPNDTSRVHRLRIGLGHIQSDLLLDIPYWRTSWLPELALVKGL